MIMTHPDPETRVGAHNILAAVLMPSLLSPRSGQNNKTAEAVSPVFGKMQKTKSQSFSFENEGKDKHTDADEGSWVDENPILGMDAEQCRETDSNSHLVRVISANTAGKTVCNTYLSLTLHCFYCILF